MIKKVFLSILAAVIILLVYLAVSKSPVDPVAYHPQKKPAMTGVLARNDLLKKADLLAMGKIQGPEDLDMDARGRIYTGTADGRIVRITPDGAVETFAETGGRCLGVRFDPRGNLIACSPSRGLISVDAKGAVTVLADSAEGVKFGFTDALDISRNGVIYFTDASDKFHEHDFLLDMIEARPHGRFMRYDPATGKVTVLMKGLCFANGVALSRAEDFVLVNETYRYRVWRYWLKGPKAGMQEIFIDNLPGMPDNISSNGKGAFWLALFTRRSDLLDFLHGYPALKAFIGKLPQSLWGRSGRYGLVASLNEKGGITATLHDPDGEVLYDITSAREFDGSLYIGSLVMDRIGRYRLVK